MARCSSGWSISPDFHSTSYIQFLAPGVVMMTALFGAGWGGMSMISDIDRGVVDRFLMSPVHRGSIIAGRVLQSVFSIVIQSIIIVVLAADPRRALPQRRVRDRGVDRGRVAAGCIVRRDLERHRTAGAAGGDADRRHELHPAAVDVPVGRVHAAGSDAQLDAVGGNLQPWSTGPSRPGRAAVLPHTDWSMVAQRTGLLVVLLVICSAFATRAFRSYQRSV